MNTPFDRGPRPTVQSWVKWIVPLFAGVLVAWLMWPDFDAGWQQSQQGLAFVALSFFMGPAALAVVYMPALLAGATTALMAYLAIRLAGK